MKIAPIFITSLSLLLTACGRHDAKLAKEIGGTWNDGSDDVLAMSPNGSFSDTIYSKGRTNIFAGTWQVNGGFLIMTLTNAVAAEPGEPIGSVRRLEVVHVDDHQLVCGPTGHTITFKR